MPLTSIRVNKGEQLVLHVELSDQDHQTLSEFLSYFDELVTTRLGGGINVRALGRGERTREIRFDGLNVKDDTSQR